MERASHHHGNNPWLRPLIAIAESAERIDQQPWTELLSPSQSIVSTAFPQAPSRQSNGWAGLCRAARENPLSPWRRVPGQLRMVFQYTSQSSKPS